MTEMEDRRDLNAFEQLYNELVERYRKIGKMSNFIFEKKYLGQNSDAVVFLRNFKAMELPRITRGVMNYHLEGLVNMEKEVFALEQRFKFLAK